MVIVELQFGRQPEVLYYVGMRIETSYNTIGRQVGNRVPPLPRISSCMETYVCDRFAHIGISGRRVQVHADLCAS